MSTRLKVLVSGTLVVIAAMLVSGLFMVQHQQEVFEEEVRGKAKLLLTAISVPCVPAMAAHEIEELDRIIEEFRVRMSDDADVESVALLDGHLRVVGHTNKKMYGRILEDQFSVDAARSPDPIFRMVDTRKNRSLLVSMPIETALPGLPGIRWGTVTAEVGLGRAEQQLRGTLLQSLKLMLLLALLTGLLLFFVAERWFLRPMARLSDAADAIRGGNLSSRSGLTGTGELAQLGYTFDRMAEELEKYTQKLQKLVYERTEKLNKTNQKLVSTMQQLTDANEKLDQLARTDALTGVANHRHMKEALAFHFALAQRGNRSLTFAMMDVDNFKNYNDTHGHPAGDVILRTLAGIVSDRVRQTDIPCRYGGEEFAVMFPDTTLEQGRSVAEFLRRQIEGHDFPLEETQPGGRLTVSIGIAELGEGMQDPLDLVAAADGALYQAKEAGRNRVVAAVPGGPDKAESGKEPPAQEDS